MRSKISEFRKWIHISSLHQNHVGAEEIGNLKNIFEMTFGEEINELSKHNIKLQTYT